MLRLRTLFLCPSNTRSKNQQWRKKRRIFKKNSQVIFPSPFPFPEFSGRVLSRDSRRWRSFNKSADVHLTVNADAVSQTGDQCPVPGSLSLLSRSECLCVWTSQCLHLFPFCVRSAMLNPLSSLRAARRYFKKYFKTSHAWDGGENLI